MQEEYVSENIQWTQIDFFNNAVVVDLLEGKRPPGLFLVLDDVCATLHGGSSGADADLQKKFAGAASTHAHFQATSDGFAVRHYAGSVAYSVESFCDKNRDVLFLDLVELMQTSTNSLVRDIYPIETAATGKTRTLKSRPTTAGSKIRSQAARLVSQLMRCTPHYIRCIKPNETKRPRDWDGQGVKHQVEYLGLKENIRVRRAGFVYRRPFAKFLQRYAILTKETWPRWQGGDERQGCEWILASACVDRDRYQLGRSKLFIKAPESLFMLEEARDRKYNMYARVLQRAFKKFFAKKRQAAQKQEAADLLYGQKQRRKGSLNRNFVGDYIGLDMKPRLVSLVGKREKIFFAETVKKYDRRFKACRRDLILTGKYLYLIGREPIKKGPEKGKAIEVIKRKLLYEQIGQISLSTLQDNFVVIHTREDYASLLEIVFKTEFLSVFKKKFAEKLGHSPIIKFGNAIEFKVKKEGWGGGGTRIVKFVQNGYGDIEILTPSSKLLTVSIGPGLPAISKPGVPLTIRTGYDANGAANRAVANGNNHHHHHHHQNNHQRAPANSVQQSNGQQPARYANTPDQEPPQEQQQQQPTTQVTNGRPILPINRPVFQQTAAANKIQQMQQQPNKLQQSAGIPIMAVLANAAKQSQHRGLIKAPPPPSEPAPPNQPTIHSAFRLPQLNSVAAAAALNGQHRLQNQQQQQKTQNDNNNAQNNGQDKPNPRPRKPQLPSLPKVKALYDYSPQDLDELGLQEGDIVEVLKQHEGGWWQGRLKGKIGLFPSNYVEKI
uniref:SH3 domain-containing protein n=1 Tax=Trichogramma kaykai TaxID=54128 RepID=A0ABD2XDY9_9HYME